jgi:hypothetical protein
MRDDVRFKRFLKEDFVVPVVYVSFENLSHDVRKVSEQLSKMISQKGSSHVKTLFAVVVSVILRDFAQTRFHQLVGHIPEEKRLLINSVWHGAHMWQKFSLQ